MSLLRTDLYTLTMADTFVRHGRDDLVSFELVVRRLPEHLDRLVVGGVVEAVDALLGLRATAEELAWLRADGRFSDALLQRLAGLRFTGTAWAIPEGTHVPAGVPLLRVTAPRVEASVVESALLAAVNYGTRVLTTASDVVAAADGRAVLDFSLRRLDGPEAGVATARLAWVAGFQGTATAEAGPRYDLPIVGTMAHHAVMLHGEDGEQRAFEDALRDAPDGTSLLVDTYDIPRGVERAIDAARATGVPLLGVRIDSGDLAAEARRARVMLDDAGMDRATVMVSGDLDAPGIRTLLAQDAPVDAFAVGTRIRSGEPLGGVYKLVAQHDVADARLHDVMKRSADKATDPGAHQVTRLHDADGTARHVLHLAHEAMPGTPLLRPVVVRGRAVPGALDLAAARAHAAAERRDAARGGVVLERSDALLRLRRRLGAPADEDATGSPSMAVAT